VFEETRLSKISVPKGVNVIEVWGKRTMREFISTMEFIDNGATHHKPVKDSSIVLKIPEEESNSFRKVLRVCCVYVCVWCVCVCVVFVYVCKCCGVFVCVCV
jgi:hypothetical protein